MLRLAEVKKRLGAGESSTGLDGVVICWCNEVMRQGNVVVQWWCRDRTEKLGGLAEWISEKRGIVVMKWEVM